MASAMIEISEKSISSEENIEEEEDFFQDCELLVAHGILTEDVKKLKDAGINTIKGIQMTIRKKLLELKFDDNKIEMIKEACTKVSLATGFMTALEADHQRKQIFKISTGSKYLDKLLDGGVESMSINEVFGEACTGKTQLAYTLCVTAQMPGLNHYMGGKVIYIDTENTFRPKRLKTIADRFNLDKNTVLENVLCARAYNSEHQYELINQVGAKLHEAGGVFKLLIVDSIMSLFRVEFSGRGEMPKRQHKLGQMMSRLQKLSEEYNIAVFITNQISSDLARLDQPDLQKPVGGNILAHASTNRILLRKAPNETRIARLYDSPDLAESEANFAITTGGIDDVHS